MGKLSPKQLTVVFGILSAVLFIVFIVLVVLDSTCPSTAPAKNLQLEFILCDNGHQVTALQLLALRKCVRPRGQQSFAVTVVKTALGTYVEGVEAQGIANLNIYTTAYTTAVDVFLNLEAVVVHKIHAHFVWLGDVSVPLAYVDFDRFFVGRRKRFFNALPLERMAMDAVTQYEREPPSLVLTYTDLVAARTLVEVMIALSGRDDVIYAPTLSHAILLTGNAVVDALMVRTLSDAVRKNSGFTSVFMPRQTTPQLLETKQQIFADVCTLVLKL
jgi:hypothetical protein